MNRPRLHRRQFLVGATATTALLLRPPAVAWAQSAGTKVSQGAGVPLIPRQLMFADPLRAWVRISPDGTRIAFLAPVNDIQNLWVAPIADVAKARPVTRVTDRSISFSFVWLHDNRHLVFFREQGGDENWQAHRVDLDTGDVRALTPGPGVRSYVQERSHRFPGELLIAHNERDKRFHDLYRVDVATGESRRIETNDRFDYYVTDTHFRVRLAVRTLDNGDVEYLRRGSADEWQVFTRVELADAAVTRPVHISDDGTTLYWRDSRGRDKAAAVAQDLVSGTMRPLAEDARADCVTLELEPVSRRPFAASATFTRARWHTTDPGYAADFAYLAKVSSGDLKGLSVSDDLQHWIAYYDRDAGPGQYFHYDRSARRARLLFVARPALAKAPLVAMRPVTIRARDGLPLVCYLSRPREMPTSRALPMVLVVHGGPWWRDSWGFSSTHQWLANRGYVVLSVNFRGSTGFGKAFVNAANLEWAGKMHDDLIDAVDWAIAHGIADPKRVAIYGASYGGYSALVGATFTPEKFACAVDIFGITNLTTFLDAIPPYWKSWQAVWKMRMGDYTTEAGRKLLEERSPLTRVDRIVRPLLIAQGANDVRVTPAESEQMVSAMQRRGIPVTYVYYADEGHGFRRVENRRSFYAVTEMFLAMHLGGRYEPLRDDFTGSSIEFKAGRDLIPGLR
jgi:dipeptidyl aminopeptidase/acylaminoacyl peptidase